jgi:hypothetical protein
MRVKVEVTRARGGELAFTYRVSGAIDALRLPPPAASERADELWRRTCFEAFLHAPDGEGYVELNLSPSTQWAAYRFDGYRSGMTVADEVSAPRIAGGVRGDAYELSASIDLEGAALLPAEAAWRLGLAAVIEDTGGRISYWALAHPPGKPDFHHADGFALELPAAGRA